MRQLLFFLTLLLLRTSPGTASSLYIPVQFIIENGNYTGSNVVLKKNGVTVFSVPGEKNMQLKLDFNEEYLVAFSKPGYITKQITIDSHVPEERIKDGLDPYKIGVRLYKQYDGVNIVVYNQPVASIRFIATLDDMGYDTDYTKSILSLLTETENRLAVKASEERKAKRLPGDKADNEVDFSSTSNPGITQDVTVKKPDNKTTPGQGINQPVSSVPADNASSGKNNKPVTAADSPAKLTAGQGSDDLTKGTATGGEDIPASYKGAEGRDHNSSKSNVESGSDIQIAVQHQEATISKTREQIFEPHRTITTVTVKKNGKTDVFHQVQYLTGDCFYFMNGSTAISAHLFEYFTGENH